jgi:senataxin
MTDPRRSRWLKKLCNMSTIIREWKGLHEAPTFPFQDMIASPTDRVDHSIARRICPPPLMAHLVATHNSSQVRPLHTSQSQNSSTPEA